MLETVRCDIGSNEIYVLSSYGESNQSNLGKVGMGGAAIIDTMTYTEGTQSL